MNLRQIDLRLLRSFIATARAGNFVKASHTLHITQSALSQQMKELSSYLALPLFEKKGRQLILTKFGNQLLHKINPLLEQLEEILLQSPDENRNIVGKMKVAATSTYSKTIALPTCMKLILENPSLNIDLKELSAQKAVEQLLEGEIDIAILPQDYQLPDLQWQELISEQFSVIGTPDLIKKLPHNLNLKFLEKYQLGALNTQFLMRQKIDSQARMQGVSLNIRMEVSTMGDLLEIAKSGKILVLGSPISLSKKDKLQSKEIKGDLLTRSAAICWRKNKFVTNAMMAFQKCASDLSETLATEIMNKKARTNRAF